MPLPGQGVDKQFYELAYTGALTSQDAGGNVSATLENLFRRFNEEHPADYRRPSMSVSDIVALKQDGVLTCHYVDRFAFTELHGFLPQDNPLKNAEIAMEDDYNMIDGVINNGPKEGPSVAELEAQVKAGQTIFLQNGAPTRSQDLVGKGGARERTEFSPQAETELSGLCDDAAAATHRERKGKESVRSKLRQQSGKQEHKRSC